MPKTWSLEKIARDQEQKDAIREILKPCPDVVKMIVTYDGVEFTALVKGSDAERMFPRDPVMRKAIKNLDTLRETPKVHKTAKLGIRITLSTEGDSKQKVQSSGVAPEHGINPITKVPFPSKLEAAKWFAAHPEYTTSLDEGSGEADPLDVAQIEIDSGEAGPPLNTRCPICKEKRYKTTQGITCYKGHGLAATNKGAKK